MSERRCLGTKLVDAQLRGTHIASGHIQATDRPYIQVTSLQQLEYIAPVHLRPEVSEVIQASKSYQTSSQTHRQAVIQQVDQLLSNVKRSV